MATTPLNIIEGHQFQYQCKAHMQLLCVNSNLPPILHTVVSEIWQIIGPIFAMDRKCLFLAHLLGQTDRRTDFTMAKVTLTVILNNLLNL